MHELACMARLAGPLVTVQLGTMAMGVVDTMMVGRLSELDMAAVALGHTVSMGLLLLPTGILMALDPLIAQAIGARDNGAVGANLRRGLWLAFAITVPLTMVMFDTTPVLDLFRQQPDVIPISRDYIRAVSAGNLGFLVFVVYRQTLQAMGGIRPILIAIILGNVLNALGDWVLVFGNLGAPKLGAVGSAWVTAGVRLSVAAALVLVAARRLAPYRAAAPAPTRADIAACWKVLRLGLPIGAHICLEVWIFNAVAILIGMWGVTELAGHSIAMNLVSLEFMVPMGIGMAAAVRVGNAIGRGDMEAARRSASVAVGAGCLFQVLAAACFLAFPGPLARLYTHEAGTIAVAMTLLPVAAAFQVFDGLQSISSGVLRGAADTTAPAWIALVGFWGIGVPVALYLAKHTELGVAGYWWGLTASLILVGGLLFLRIIRRFKNEITRYETRE